VDFTHVQVTLAGRDDEKSGLEAGSNAKLLGGTVLSLAAESLPELLCLLSFGKTLSSCAGSQDRCQLLGISFFFVGSVLPEPEPRGFSALSGHEISFGTVEVFAKHFLLLDCLGLLSEWPLDSVHGCLVLNRRTDMISVVADESIGEEGKESVIFMADHNRGPCDLSG